MMRHVLKKFREQYPIKNNYTATYLPSRKSFKKDE